MYVEQGEGGPLHLDPRLRFIGEGVVDGGQQDPELELHHLGVQAFLGPEVFVDHGFGNARSGGDLFDSGAVQAPDGEEAAADIDQL